ncbi:MAG: sugar phosphorylase, partial [Opitutales bacterium]
MSPLSHSSLKHVSNAKLKTIRRRLARLYGGEAERLLERFYHMIGRYGVGLQTLPVGGRWDEHEAVLITYADMVQGKVESPLASLRKFCSERLKGAFSTIHVLPFFPWSSDDGFSVIDYHEVDHRYGDWEDVRALGSEFNLMFDLVLNHCSSQSEWFKEYVAGVEPAANYFLEADPDADISSVVRPRPSSLLTPYTTRLGERHVWTTFSPDQVDLNWRCPDLLFEFLDLLMLYLSMGCRVFRLDAIAFLWKEMGTNCLHLPQTHEVVKLIRDFLEVVAPETILLTETNVPHQENVSYFGRGNEAHLVYQFSLPPLLLHGLLQGNSRHLTVWASQLEPPPRGCAFLNFTASHDGIGVRPLENILSPEEILLLAEKVEARGGQVSMRTLEDESKAPYELNVTYFDALCEPGDDVISEARFLCSQAVALALQGIPAVYFHSLTATRNHHQGVEETGLPRSINRRKWKEGELRELLGDSDSLHARVFEWYLRLLRRRASCPAFHPDAPQRIHDFGAEVFALERCSLDSSQTVLCLFNFIDIPV